MQRPSAGTEQEETIDLEGFQERRRCREEDEEHSAHASLFDSSVLSTLSAVRSLGQC